MVFLTLGVSGMQKPSRGDLKSLLLEKDFQYIFVTDFCLGNQLNMHI